MKAKKRRTTRSTHWIVYTDCDKRLRIAEATRVDPVNGYGERQWEYYIVPGRQDTLHRESCYGEYPTRAQAVERAREIAETYPGQMAELTYTFGE